MKKLTHNPLFRLLLGVCILLTIQFYAKLFSMHQFNAHYFNEVLNKNEVIAEKGIQEIEKEQDFHRLFKSINKYKHLFNDRGIAFFVYKNQQLQFWTNRSISVPNTLNVFKHKRGVILLKNGWYEYLKKKNNTTTFLSLILIKHHYKIKNKYLKNDFHPVYRAPNTAKIVFTGNFPIKSITGKILFYLKNVETTNPIKKTNWVILILFFTAFLLIVSFVSKQARKITFLRTYSWLIVIIFILISRLILFDFNLPISLFSQELFSPNIYAQSSILPSLGDFLITSVFFLTIILYLSKGIRTAAYVPKFIAYLLLLFSVVTPFILTNWFEGLIKNSKINFDINYLLNLNEYSFIGIFSILLIFISIIILVKTVFYALEQHASIRYYFKNIYFVIALIALLIAYFFFNINFLLSAWFCAVILVFCIKTEATISAYKSIMLTFIIAFTATYGFVHFGKQKEKLTKTFWAKKVAKEKDPIAEFLFKEIKTKIERDTLLANHIANYWNNNDKIDKYLRDKYFSGFWTKYDLDIYPCLENDTILVNDKNISCLAFFNNKINNETDNPFNINDDINFLYAKDGISSYLGKIPINKNKQTNNGYLFIEFFPKTFSKAEGYPELLLNQEEISQSINLNKYSFAKYKNGNLVNNSGNYDYETTLDKNLHFNDNGFLSFAKNGYNHLVFKADKFTSVIISSEQKSIFNYITIFSYLFIFTGLLVLFFGIFFKIAPFKWVIAFTDFNIKIQLFIISSIFLSFILFAWGTSYYIKKQYLIKNHKNISEKVQSILIELGHKLGDKKRLDASLNDEMTYYLIKFSNVFYTDINLFDKKGNLLASSRPEIFDAGLTSKKMNIDAYKMIHQNKKSNYIHNEKIGSLNYLSAYVPFRNDNNKVLAYLNLPYFAKQNELENELSDFFTSLINIYGLLFLISAIIAVFFANYISEPLRMIRDKIAALQLEKSFDLIDWKSDDEIGALVAEYNKKVVELEKNALKLAKSERESAWREMAKQVAHEIKNPLTPMKLSIQHLQKSAHENTDNLTDRIDRTAQTLIEQIDTLTNIANEFSNFAKMPKANQKAIDLLQIIETTIDLYKKENIEILLTKHNINAMNIMADNDQMHRVFNNLIKNAIQAIPEKQKGKIKVNIAQQHNNYLIAISDNGVGISNDKKDKIFVPNFTTKTNGMGLGLAMVKNILENINAKIWFESTPNETTTFFVEIPIK